MLGVGLIGKWQMEHVECRIDNEHHFLVHVLIRYSLFFFLKRLRPRKVKSLRIVAETKIEVDIGSEVLVDH